MKLSEQLAKEQKPFITKNNRIKKIEYSHFLNQINNMKINDVYNIPFPLIVYGTLMHNYKNNYLINMNVQEQCRGYVNNFYSEQLILWNNEESCAPCEAYLYYDDVIFQKIIKNVDTLEKFSVPSNKKEFDMLYSHSRKNIYVKVLVKMHLFEDDEINICDNYYNGNSCLFAHRNIYNIVNQNMNGNRCEIIGWTYTIPSQIKSNNNIIWPIINN